MEKADIEKRILKQQKEIEKQLAKIRENEEKILKEILNEEKEIKSEEQKIIAEEKVIENQERDIKKKENEIEYLIKSKVVSRKYTDIIDWKLYIWNDCQFKVQDEETTEITYHCKKLNAACNFTTCPINFY